MNAAAGAQVAQRTDARGFLIKAIENLRALVIPGAVGAVSGGPDLALVVGGTLGGIALLFSAVASYLAWTRLTYVVSDTDIRVESGLLTRQARSVSFDRIEDVSLKQGLLARIAGVVELTLETGAGAGDDIALAYLSQAEGERVRTLVRDRAPSARAAGASIEASEDPANPVLFAMAPRRVLLLGLFNFSLIVFVAAAGLLLQNEELLPFDLWDVEDWRHRLEGPAAYLVGLGPLGQAFGALLAVLFLVVCGALTGVVRTALAQWNFVLERSEQGFRRRRGLLTRTDIVLPQRRVQAIMVYSGLLRRLFGWHGLSLVSLAADAAASHHDAVPLGTRDEIAKVVEETGIVLPYEGLVWHRMAGPSIVVEALARMRWWIVLSLVLAAAQALTDPRIWFGMRYLALVPLAVGVWKALRLGLSLLRTRFAMDEDHLFLSGGWAEPYLHVCPREKLHSATIIQGPFARRANYAALVVGLAGAPLSMSGIPLAVAHETRAALLESMRRRDYSLIN